MRKVTRDDGTVPTTNAVNKVLRVASLPQHTKCFEGFYSKQYRDRVEVRWYNEIPPADNVTPWWRKVKALLEREGYDVTVIESPLFGDRLVVKRKGGTA